MGRASIDAENSTALFALLVPALPCCSAASVKVDGKKGVGKIARPRLSKTFTFKVTSTAGRLPTLRLRKFGTLVPSITVPELLCAKIEMQHAVDAVLDCATTLSMAILVPARDTVMQYTWNRVAALRPLMVTELSFAALVVATKFCSINAPVEVGATTMPDCSSYGDAAQYTVPRSLSFVFTVMLVLVELNVWDTMDGAGSKSL